MQLFNEDLTPEDDNAPEQFFDKRTDDRIREHLTNEKDNISADDINNVQSDISSPAKETEMNNDVKAIDNTKKDEYIGKDDDDKDKPEIITPWNVID